VLQASALPDSNYSWTTDTVTDTVTGLVWQRVLDGSTHTWADAKTYCANLTMAGGGWRLPTKNELLSVVDFSLDSPAINRNAFPNTPSDWFWSSTVFACSSSIAWLVNFNPGITSYSGVGGGGSVRCVR